MDSACTELGLPIVSPEQIGSGDGFAVIADWLGREHIGHLAVQWDLDSLSPAGYRSILPAEPGTDPAKFPAAVGRLDLDDVRKLLDYVLARTELVGLTVAEHMPWDALNMRRTLEGLPFFG